MKKNNYFKRKFLSTKNSQILVSFKTSFSYICKRFIITKVKKTNISRQLLTEVYS